MMTGRWQTVPVVLGMLPHVFVYSTKDIADDRLFHIYCFSFFVAPVAWQFLILHERMTGYR